jgi:hypothetical protein
MLNLLKESIKRLVKFCLSQIILISQITIIISPIFSFLINGTEYCHILFFIYVVIAYLRLEYKYNRETNNNRRYQPIIVQLQQPNTNNNNNIVEFNRRDNNINIEVRQPNQTATNQQLQNIEPIDITPTAPRRSPRLIHRNNN